MVATVKQTVRTPYLYHTTESLSFTASLPNWRSHLIRPLKGVITTIKDSVSANVTTVGELVTLEGWLQLTNVT